MKLVSVDIVFQEVPDEVSLALSFSGCKNNCIGCHSAHLKEDIGDIVDVDSLLQLINARIVNDPITCILFFGGDQYDYCSSWISELRLAFPKLKFALYSGSTSVGLDLMNALDYIKVGPYIDDLGGLTSITTNQRMYKKSLSGLFQDITERFWH